MSGLAAPFQGTWQYAGVDYVDDINRIEVITSSEDLNIARFFRSYKKRLKRRFRKFDILITVQDISTI